MTNQREAQKEDLLLDLYKLNAYIPNDGEGNTLTPFGNFAEGYRVGKADQAETIAQLQAKIDTILITAEALVSEERLSQPQRDVMAGFVAGVKEALGETK